MSGASSSGSTPLAIRATQNMTPAGTTHYVYDLAGHLIAEASGTGTTVTEYVWLDDMPLAVVANVDTSTPHLYFVHADHLHRPIKMTDSAEAIVWDAVYKPFGEVYSISGTASNNLRFPGQYFLIEDGLHYNWYRHYDPTIGRYLQSDPFGMASLQGMTTKPTANIGTSPALDGVALRVDSPAARRSAVLPDFLDGPSVYAYGKSRPTLSVDFTGRYATQNFTPVPGMTSQSINSCTLAQNLSSFCRKINDLCIDRCSDTDLPSGDYGFKFFRCVNSCMASFGCPSVSSP